MKYAEEYKRLKALENYTDDCIELNDKLVLRNFDFTSRYSKILPGGIDNNDTYEYIPDDPGDYEPDVISRMLMKNDADIAENIHFRYHVVMPKGLDRARQIILMFHGFNEKYWDKYLPWIEYICEHTGKSVVMFGAGGAARAIGVELALAGARALTVVNRSALRGEPLVRLLNERTATPATLVQWPREFAIPEGTDIVVNATSIGLANGNQPLDIDAATLKPGMVVADVIVDPPDTRFLRDARTRGCTVIDGLGMLINQGVIGVKYWTGIDADPAVMRKKLEEIFSA